MVDYEQIDAMLDRVVLDKRDWLTKLTNIRKIADDAYNKGALADYQWRALVTRSAKIQDQFNDH